MEPLEWCRQRYLVPGNPLTLTLPYAPASHRDAILALHAVCGEIAAIPVEVSEPGVARQKLTWWRRALAESLPHPAVQALQDSGALAALDPAELDALAAGVAETLEAPRFNGPEELLDHCRRLAGPGARMEAALLDADDPDAGRALSDVAAGGYLIRLVRDLAVDARAGRWSVPLAWQAEYQVSRTDLAGGRQDRAVAALIRHMLEEAVRVGERALAQWPAAGRWRHRHALLRAALDKRLAARLHRRPGRIFRERAGSAGPGAAMVVWWTARRLRREAGRARAGGL